MTLLEPSARRLIAGALGPERRPYHKDADEPRWFEPLHVRAPGASREALAGSVAAGADVLVAPTWLTHRRALLPVGETRRAAVWTAAAVRIAREAVDRGLELRELAAEGTAAERDEPAERDPGGPRAGSAGRGADDGRVGSVGRSAGRSVVTRNPVLVAGALPFLGAVAEAEAGRLAPRDAGVERDLRAAAGLLADADVDLLLTDGGSTVVGARMAADAASETGLPVWMTVPVGNAPVPALLGGEAIEAWATSMIHAGVTGFLLVPAPGCDAAGAVERLRAAGVPAERTGVLAEPPGAPMPSAAPARWLEAGAWHLGLLDGATPERLAVLRTAIDAVDEARLAVRAAERDRWAALVEDAARRAPGGRAVWIGPRDTDVPLPAGFAWAVVPAFAAAALPEAELRLVIAATPVPGEWSEPRLAALLEPGGILLARGLEPGAVIASGLRLLQVMRDPAVTLARRDP